MWYKLSGMDVKCRVRCLVGHMTGGVACCLCLLWVAFPIKDGSEEGFVRFGWGRRFAPLLLGLSDRTVWRLVAPIDLLGSFVLGRLAFLDNLVQGLYSRHCTEEYTIWYSFIVNVPVYLALEYENGDMEEDARLIR